MVQKDLSAQLGLEHVHVSQTLQVKGATNVPLVSTTSQNVSHVSAILRVLRAVYVILRLVSVNVNRTMEDVTVASVLTDFSTFQIAEPVRVTLGDVKKKSVTK